MKGCVDRLTAFYRIYGLGVQRHKRVYIFKRLARFQSVADSTRVVSARHRCEVGDIRISWQVVRLEQRENAIMRRSFRLGSVIKYIVVLLLLVRSRFPCFRECCFVKMHVQRAVLGWTSDLLAERRQRRIASRRWVSIFFYLTFTMR